MIIHRIQDKIELASCVPVIQQAFVTVAKDFELTSENSPTNPAFITVDKLEALYDKGLELFKLVNDDDICGFIAIEKSPHEPSIFYIEKVAVLPTKRHKGYGARLMNFAIQRIQQLGGKKISIGIINENSQLKKWYQTFGFTETAIKQFPHLPFTVCFMELKV